MRQTDYITRLARAARWYLPPEEAAETAADYQELLDQDARSDEVLCRDLGNPRAAVRLLLQPRSYRTWLAVFLALSLCLLIPGVSSLPGSLFWFVCFNGYNHFGRLLAFAGAAGALIWFRRTDRAAGPLPRALHNLLVLLAVWCGAILLLNYGWMQEPQRLLNAWGTVQSMLGPPGHEVSRIGQLIAGFFEWGGFLAALIGEYGLVQARVEDRRWSAVYVLGMTAMLLSMESLSVLSSMTLDSSLAGWWVPYFQGHLAIAALGLVEMGVSLC